MSSMQENTVRDSARALLAGERRGGRAAGRRGWSRDWDALGGSLEAVLAAARDGLAPRCRKPGAAEPRAEAGAGARKQRADLGGAVGPGLHQRGQPQQTKPKHYQGAYQEEVCLDVETGRNPE